MPWNNFIKYFFLALVFKRPFTTLKPAWEELESQAENLWTKEDEPTEKIRSND